MAEESEGVVVAYMAAQFRGLSSNQGWAPTNWGQAAAASGYTPNTPNKAWTYLPVDTSAGATGENGPPTIAPYGPVRTMQFSVKREYPGSPSGGGPATATRAESSDIFVQRNVDQVSPLFMQYAMSGMYIQNLHLVYNILTPQNVSEYVTWVRLGNAVITGYYYDTSGKEGKGGQPAVVDHYESLTIWYTTIEFQSFTTTRGWNVATDTAID